jgi:drug/metabolite transporter (DMT)-like permease
MAAGAFSFSVMAALVKLAGRTLPTMEVVVARSVVTSLLSWLALTRAGIPFGGREPRLLLLRGVLGFLSLTCFYYAVVHLPLADATVIQYTNPVFTALIAAALLGEALRRKEVALTLGSLAGVVVVTRPSFLFGGGGSALAPLGVTAALFGAVFSASAYVTVRRLRREEPMVVVFWFGAVSLLLGLPFLTLGETRLPRGWEWALLAGVGVSTHLGQVFLTRGLMLEPAGRATAVGYLQILFAAIWGILLFGERPDLATALGALVIVGCTWLLARSRATPPTVAPGGGPPLPPAGGQVPATGR